MIQSFHACWIMKAAELEAVKEWVPKVDAVFHHFKSFLKFFLLIQNLRRNPWHCAFAHVNLKKIKTYSFPTMYYKWRKVNIICFISKKTARGRHKNHEHMYSSEIQHSSHK